MGKTICIASGKGGTGKSTICANLGVALAQLGVKTLIIDGDVEGASLSLMFGASFDAPTLHDYLAKRIKEEDLVFSVPGSEAKLVIGSIAVDSLMEVELERFKDAVKRLSEDYGIVLVDGPSGIGIDSFTAISSCEYVLFVVLPDILSITYILKIKEIANNLGRKMLGIVVNKTGGRYDIPAKYIEELVGLPVLIEIEQDEEVEKALYDGKLLMLSSPDSKTVRGIKKLASALVRSV